MKKVKWSIVLGLSILFLGFLYFRPLSFEKDLIRIKPELFDEYYKDTCGISKNDMISFLQANAVYSLKERIKDCGAKVHILSEKKKIRR